MATSKQKRSYEDVVLRPKSTKTKLVRLNAIWEAHRSPDRYHPSEWLELPATQNLLRNLAGPATSAGPAEGSAGRLIREIPGVLEPKPGI